MRIVTVISALASLLLAWPAGAVVRDIEFPAVGDVSYQDDFGDPRSGGRTHEGVDIMGEKMMPLVSAVDGWVRYVTVPEASWGYGLELEDADGWRYWYLHINNDTPGTDDGLGGEANAFAPGIYRGARVTRGQTVAYMGDSGNAERTGAHLHFEIHDPSDTPVNPYESLRAASRGGTFDPEAERFAASTISADLGLQSVGTRYCLSDTLVTTPETKAVYYCGEDGRRYVFPNADVYFSWYDDFTSVMTVSVAELAAMPIGGVVTYRPGTKLVKLTTDPKVYAVARGGVLRWVSSEDVAVGLYGADWADRVVDVPDADFINFTIGDPITVTP